MMITPYRVAQTFIGTKELSGLGQDNHLIQAMIESCDSVASTDEIPWCSAFVNFVAKTLGLPRSKSLSARSWLQVGQVIQLADATVDSDIVILKRGINPAQGHVGFYAGEDVISNYNVYLLGGNQNNQVCIEKFSEENVLGVRRLVF